MPFSWTDRAGKPHVHYFDFRVSLRDGTRTAVMVKSACEARKDRIRDELRQVAWQVPPEFADRVRLVTDQDLDPVELHNAELLHAVRLPDPEADAAARRATAGMIGSVRVGDLVDWIAQGGRGFRAVVRLIRSHELELARHERISHDALVRRRTN